MFRQFKLAGCIAALAATSLALASPAQARERYNRGSDDAAVAIAAGIAGLAIGAALASDGHRHRHYRGCGHRGYWRASYREDYPRYYRNDRYRDRYRDRDRGRWNDDRGDWRGDYDRGGDRWRDGRRW